MIKKLAKKILYPLIGTAIALSPGCSNQIQELIIKPFIETNLELQGSFSLGKIKNISEEMRTTPIHKDDGYARPENNGPTKEDSARLPALVELKLLKAGLETKINKNVYLDIYGDLSLNISNFILVGKKHKRNYTNAPGTDKRGYGAALTYWSVKPGPLFIPGIKADLHISTNKDWDFIIGGGYRRYDLEIERGWDRYDSLEKYRDTSIAKVDEKSIYIGFESKDRMSKKWHSLIKLGVNFNDYKTKGNEIKIDSKFSFFISGGMICRF